MEIAGLRTGGERQREERRTQRWEPGTAADSEKEWRPGRERWGNSTSGHLSK